MSFHIYYFTMLCDTNLCQRLRFRNSHGQQTNMSEVRESPNLCFPGFVQRLKLIFSLSAHPLNFHCPDQASFIAIALIDQDLCWLFNYAQFIQNQFNTNEQSIPNAHSPFIVNAFQCNVYWSVKSFNLLYLNSGSSIKLAFFLVNSILCRLM